jgi:hypothetical protein
VNSSTPASPRSPSRPRPQFHIPIPEDGGPTNYEALRVRGRPLTLHDVGKHMEIYPGRWADITSHNITLFQQRGWQSYPRRCNAVHTPWQVGAGCPEAVVQAATSSSDADDVHTVP